MIPALAVITTLNDAVAIANAMIPLVQKMVEGGTVTQEDYDTAIAERKQAVAQMNADVEAHKPA